MHERVTPEIIGKFPLFSGLDREHLEALARLSQLRRVSRRDLVFREGDEAVGFFLLMKGRVKLTKLNPAGKEQILHFVAPGNSFAEAALYMQRSYPANAEALEDSELVFIPRRGFGELLSTHQGLAVNLIAHLSRYLNLLTSKIEDLTLLDATTRLARFILEGMDPVTGVVRLPAAKGQTASSLGMAVETFSRTLARLKEEGWLKEASPGVFQVLDETALRAYTEGAITGKP